MKEETNWTANCCMIALQRIRRKAPLAETQHENARTTARIICFGNDSMDMATLIHGANTIV